jgi:pimeloyl-ACP methyl ester carboxylesterase
MRRILGNWAYRTYLAAGILLVSLVVSLTLIPPLMSGVHTGLFVLQVLDLPLKPQSWFTAGPMRQEIAYPKPNGEGMADIYRIPDERKRAAVLIFLGANATGRDDKDVINLGNALSRAGFVVMFSWSPTMGLQNNIDPNEIESLVWAFQYLKSQDYVDRDRIGMGGFSVGGSFAMVAAADPRIRDDVVFLNSFGAYYNMRDLFLQVASRSTFYRGQREPWDVDRLTWRVFANELIETLDNPVERDLFTRHYLRGQEAPLGQLEAVSEQARTVRRLLEGTTPQHAEDLLMQLPADFHEEMASISPSEHMSDLKARLLIMHDRRDLLIPAAESRRLARALEGEGRGDFRYTETEIFEHVRAGSSGNIWELTREAAKLYRHMYEIVSIATRS